MNDHGFLESTDFATAKDIIESKNGQGELFTIEKSMKVGEVITLLNKEGISQVPVIDHDNFVGSVTDTKLLHELIGNPDLKDKAVEEVMDDPLPFVALDNTLDVLSSLIDHDNQALLVRDQHKKIHIITQHDLLVAMVK